MPNAFITGAGRGIGRRVATVLLAEGWNVLAGVRDASAAPAGSQPEVIDVADAAGIQTLALRLRATGLRLDALVNNAGIYEATPSQLWRVNVLGPLRLTRALAPALAQGARVVLVTSGLGRKASQPRELARRLADPALTLEDLEHMAAEAPGGYGATKAAINAMARLFAAEFRPRGILVNAVSPGWCRTDMGGAGAPRSVEQGADSILWGVRLASDGPTGGVFEDGVAME
jgi:NAD(P)-dependent dehydrogenase (short-subunit alcohol dehydrogenase family)